MVRETFAALRDALAADSPTEVNAVMEQLDSEIVEQRAREEGYVTQARAVRGSRATSDTAAETALALQQQVGETVAARGRIFTAVDNYLTGRKSGQEAANIVGGELAAFDDLREAADSFESAVTTDELPPALVLTGLETLAVPKGTAIEEAVSVDNVGGSELTGVSLSVETDPTVDLELSPTDLGRIGPEESVTATLSGTPLRDTDVLVTASGGDQSDSIDVTINVRDVREIIGEALTDIYELLKRLRSALSGATDGGSDDGRGKENGRGGRGTNGNGNGNRGRSFEAKLEAATKSLAEAFDRIEDGDPESAVDGKLEAATEQIGAFVNEVEAQSGKRLPEKAAAQLTTDGRALVATIETAKTAER